MAESRIRWKQTDFMQLGKAVKEFNRKIDKLQAMEEKSYLPSKIEYVDVKEQIYSRKQFKRILKSLRDFKMKGAEDLYTTQAGEQITKWEKQQLDYQIRVARGRLSYELGKLRKPLENGYSRVQMGSERVNEIEDSFERLRNLENLKGYDFRLYKEQLSRWGSADYSLKKAIIYQQNYMKDLEKYSHLDNYDALMKQLKNISNPFEFYKFMSKNELTADLTYQSDQFYTQEAFNSFIQDLGIDIEIDSIIEENL